MQELEYLRDELNQRIIFDNDNRNKLIGSILMVWGGVLVLFTLMHKGIIDGNEKWTVFWYFAIINVFFISVVILHVFSRRFYDNINQVFRLAAYNTVFHEKRPDISDKKGEIIAWELVTFEMTKEELDDTKEKHTYTLNIEYLFFAIFATIMEIFLLFVLFFKTPDIKDCMDFSDILMVVLCVIYIIASCVLSFLIYNNLVLNPKKWLDRKKHHFKFFINYAVKAGYYHESELAGQFGETFLREIGYDYAARYCGGPQCKFAHGAGLSTCSTE